MHGAEASELFGKSREKEFGTVPVNLNGDFNLDPNDNNKFHERSVRVVAQNKS